MSEFDFTSILDMPAGEAKAPIPLPEGTYEGIIESYELGTSSNKGTPYIKFICVPCTALGDVDEEELEEIENWTERKTGTFFYLTENALFMFDEFAKNAGIEAEGKTYAEVFPEMVDVNVTFTIVHGISTQTEKPYAQIDSIVITE
jgi:hypothetical protein